MIYHVQDGNRSVWKGGVEMVCDQCPRKCGVDRSHGVGFCGADQTIRLARAALHPWEEPCISGEKGSGTIFFVGCNLRCIYCQNRRISRQGNVGTAVTPEEMEAIILELQREGASNINLVTPTPYAMQLIPVLRSVRPQLRIPVVYNCGGYESVDTLRALDGLVDIYLPDFKYESAQLSELYSCASDYSSVALAALDEMIRQTGAPVLGEDGLMKSGVLVRHLVLPGCREDSVNVLKLLHGRFGNQRFLLSLMSQFTPVFSDDSAPKNLRRRVTSFEYGCVLEMAEQLGFEGYLQERSSAVKDYTPDFDRDGTVTEKIKRL